MLSLSRRAAFSLAITAGIAVSASLEIPLPSSYLQGEFTVSELGDAPLHWQVDDASFSWARGQATIQGLTVTQNGAEVLHLAHASATLAFRLFSEPTILLKQATIIGLDLSYDLAQLPVPDQNAEMPDWGSWLAMAQTVPAVQVSLQDITADLRFDTLTAKLQLSAQGDSHSGLHLQLDAQSHEIELSTQTQLAPFEQSDAWWLRVRGSSNPMATDGPAIARLRKLAPKAIPILDALQLRGAANADFAFDYSISLDAELQTDAPRWATAASFDDLGVTYSGLPAADGTRPSFPYPADGLHGLAAFSDRHLCFLAEGPAGTAEIDALGHLHFTPKGLAIDIQVDVERAQLDASIFAALDGIPNVNPIVQQLGLAQQGAANAQLRIYGTPGVKPGLYLDVQAHDVLLQPQIPGVVLPPIPVMSGQIHLQPRLIRFSGDAQLYGGQSSAHGFVQSRGLQQKPLVSLQINAEGLQPSLQQLDRLVPQLKRPAIDPTYSAETVTQISVLLDGLSPNFLLQHQISDGQVNNLPNQLTANHLHANLFLASNHSTKSEGLSEGGLSEGFHIFVPRVTAESCHGLFAASLTPNKDLLATTRQCILEPELLHEWASQAGISALDIYQCTARMSAQALIPLDAPENLSASFRLHPLNIKTQEDAFLSQALPALTVQGDWQLHSLAPLHLTASELEFHSLWGVATARDFDLIAQQDGSLSISTRWESQTGIRIHPESVAFFGEAPANAIRDLGLSALVTPVDLTINVTLSKDAFPALSATGSLELRDLQLTASPVVERGRADLQIEHFQWQRRNSDRIQIQINQGGADVANLPISKAKGRLTLTPSSASLTHFEASLLSGIIETAHPKNPGSIHVSFESGTPVSAKLYASGLELDTLQEQLNLPGALSGTVAGMIDMAGPTPNPLTLKGNGWAKIHDGSLGSVPVLSDIFRAAGIDPPVFQKGEFVFQANGAGTMRVEKLQLDHPLLEVNGKGWVMADTTLKLKATIRTLSFIGRLPGISHFLDWFVEQDISGPAERPIISQRGFRKLIGGELPTAFFPLWLPTVPEPNGMLSPAIPVNP